MTRTSPLACSHRAHRTQPAQLRALALALVALLTAACMLAIATPRAWAAEPATVALTVVDATDNNVVYNGKVEGLTTDNTVEDMLAAAGFTKATTWTNDKDYTVSNGAPYFLGKAYDPDTGNYWQTIFEGSSNNWANALLVYTSWETGETSVPTLKDGGHYQYIYGNGSQEIAPMNPETYETTFAYTGHGLVDPFVDVDVTFDSSLYQNLQARFAKGGAGASLDNMTSIAAPALALDGKADAIDADAIRSAIDANRAAGSLSAGRLAKYIIALTAAGTDCTSAYSNGKLTNLIAEMESKMSAAQSFYDLVMILPAYNYGGYSKANSPMTEEAMINAILAQQADSGLFGGQYASAQSSAQAILALQPYYASNEAVKTALDRAVSALWAMQNDDGGIRYDASGENSDVDTTGEAQAALAALGIGAGSQGDAEAANPKGITPISFLSAVADASKDGYTARGSYNEAMTSSCALAGLAAYHAMKDGKDGYLYATRTGLVPDLPADAAWTRLGGPIALDTMSLIVDEGAYPAGGTVVLATSGGYWDALTAAGVAGMAKAPVLITAGTKLSDQTKAQLQKLKPVKIVVCGGPAAISENVVKAAAQASSPITTTVRLWGQNAEGTANDIFAQGPAQTGGAWSSDHAAFLCTNATFQDALSAAPLSYALHMPIFLTHGAARIAPETLKAMKDGGITTVYIVGGTAAIAPAVEQTLKSNGFAVADRFGGKTSIETSELVAAYGLTRGMSADKMGVATYKTYYDALTGAALCGKNNAVIALVAGASSHSISGFVGTHANDIWNGYIFGGPAAVDNATKTALENATKAAAR